MHANISHHFELDSDLEELEDDPEADNSPTQGFHHSDHDDDYFEEIEDLIRNGRAGASSSSVALAAIRRRSYVPGSPTANITAAVPGLAGDDLPGAKARKVLGLDSEGWEIGPGSSEHSDGPHAGSSSHTLGRSSTSRRATARMTALLNGGSSSSSSLSSASASVVTDGLPTIQSSSSNGSLSSSRRHSLLPAMLGLGSRRTSAVPAQQPIPAQPYAQSAAESRLSPSSIVPFPRGGAGGGAHSASAASSGPGYSTSYFHGSPSASSLSTSTSLPHSMGSISMSPQLSVPDTPTLSSSHSSPAPKGLKKGRGRKQQSSTVTPTATGDESGSSRGVGTVSLADAQDWERALENAERNASWYSSIAHRPRPRPPAAADPIPTPQRRPSNDPHPLPPSIINGSATLPLERDRNRRPSLGNEHLAWNNLSADTGPNLNPNPERIRRGSFGSSAPVAPRRSPEVGVIVVALDEGVQNRLVRPGDGFGGVEERVSPPVGENGGGGEGEGGFPEGTASEDAFYREMYARGLPSDLPRPVSVHSGSQSDEEGDDGLSWQD
ncbi:unnamed protein product [Tilletia controversa]|uniref:Uncharacterized protein n=3 Tax=Tilletia TaxID=13289 RepID=A0A8X7SUS4_9BASI|nr:hypothetical protein CF336_g6141 [Tilletia laevis]KAE8192539.1 hypothetical protein CF328_g5326 [Tilletia controversa]KAE8256257.1 hypothetical protein A4X03_0g5445 [Tilletia caries]KAE8194115.1 hypothetical protein CF335_g5426 [Tilletia laevis]KAE8243210.1 hypothetical protein A4X06_0g6478 [Tilletia controversa]